ncbi:MAG: hypothetical protein CMB80_03310 [Flammeovirgaceae bacterium]|nr:hypothetical protein [Flammeovirgaceae bacterium]|tara:strand:+ start:47 stop:238 length:192 start_codon:yes stop_codon:yes gene_type:complete
MKIGDLVRRVYPTCSKDNPENGLGVVLEILFNDYWGDTAVVWWDNETQCEYEQRHLEIVNENR